MSRASRGLIQAHCLRKPNHRTSSPHGLRLRCVAVIIALNAVIVFQQLAIA